MGATPAPEGAAAPGASPAVGAARADTIFFTGFPGFLGTELLPRALARAPGTHAVCLVQPGFMTLARQRLEHLMREHPAIVGRATIVEGDLTESDMGIRDPDALVPRVTEIFHLAAVYDLSVARDQAMRVNVEGTKKVLAFAKRCPALRRLQYVSTCYVSGRYPGEFTEGMLEQGQRFNNYYEETKYLAEVEVQRAMREGMPVTIYRPAVVVGDSTTGETQKYDGPYFVMQWLLRQPGLAIMPVVGNVRRTRFNVVPRDFVVNAIAWLSAREESAGQVYQLADPQPQTVHDLLIELARATHRRLIRVRLPLALAKFFIERVPGVYRLLRIPASAIDYFVLPTTFGTSRARTDLLGSGIACPPFHEYSDRLVAFMKAHPEVGAGAMT